MKWLLSVTLVVVVSIAGVVSIGAASGSPTARSDGRLHNFRLLSSAGAWAVVADNTNYAEVLAQSMSTVSPNEGTIGTQFTITGSGFGSKKGKVLVGNVPPRFSNGPIRLSGVSS